MTTLHSREEGKLGPAMAALTERQRGFVYAMLDTGGTNVKRCYLMAFPACESDNAAAVGGHRLAHDERVQAAIQEEARRRMNGAAILAVNTMLKVCENSTSDAMKLKAAGMIADRAGLHALAETRHNVVVSRPEDERRMIQEIHEMAQQLGIDPKKLLASQGVNVVDAEFEEVSSAEVAEKPAAEEVDWDNIQW